MLLLLVTETFGEVILGYVWRWLRVEWTRLILRVDDEAQLEPLPLFG